MSKSLTLEQNQRVRQLANDLIAKHDGNVSAAARALKKNQSWLARISQGKLGGSLSSASLLCHALNKDVGKELGIEQLSVAATWNTIDGYEGALAQAKEMVGGIYDHRVWYEVGQMILPMQPPVDPWVLVQMAHLVAVIIARASPSAPPSGTGAGSVKRIRAARRG